MASSSAAAAAKPNFSSSLLKLKFMQKAKRSEPEPESTQDPAVDESKWTATVSSSKGCRVIIEKDPAPGAQSGRMSFAKVYDVPASAPEGASVTLPQAAPSGAASGAPSGGARAKHAEQGRDTAKVVPLRPAKRHRS